MSKTHLDMFIYSRLFYKILSSQGVTTIWNIGENYFLQDIRVKKYDHLFDLNLLVLPSFQSKGLRHVWHAIWWPILILQHAKKAIFLPEGIHKVKYENKTLELFYTCHEKKICGGNNDPKIYVI